MATGKPPANSENPPKLNLVLVEPQIPQNTGNVARTCAVIGAALHLVGPLGFVVTSAKLKRAGLDYWDKLDITHYDTLEAFLAPGPAPLFLFTTKAPRLYTRAVYPPGSYLVFGREDAGLPPHFLRAHPECLVRLPMRDSLRSLNLSNAVAVGAYEALRQNAFRGLG
jgi:tRNA (cytidine/uridine-2'-O-)-methyltransferase